MKRFHIHIAVESLESSILFYSKLFGVEPTVRKLDYAKWMLDDPRINFAISTHSARHGVNHLGIQVDSPAELAAIRAQIKQEGLSFVEEGKTNCCYAHSDKSWLTDPNGIAWETYHTMKEADLFKDDSSTVPSACCKSATLNAKASTSSGCCDNNGC